MQVKFRGKRVDGGGWVVGSIIGYNVIVGKIIDFNDEYFNTEFWYKVEPSSIGMFTGLNDKNGKEIYGAVGESGGDILKYTYLYYRNPREIITTVKWEYHGFYIGRNETKFIDSRALYWMKKYGEIIGNAFDNPELLEK